MRASTDAPAISRARDPEPFARSPSLGNRSVDEPGAPSSRVGGAPSRRLGVTPRATRVARSSAAAMSASGSRRPTRERSKPNTCVDPRPRVVPAIPSRVRPACRFALFVFAMPSAARRPAGRSPHAPFLPPRSSRARPAPAHPSRSPTDPHPPSPPRSQFRRRCRARPLGARRAGAREIIRGGGRTRPADPAVKPEPSEPAPPARARTPRGNDGLSEDVSWAVDESGAKDDEFVVDAALEADGADDMETFEEELENAPIDLEAVKMEVNALKKESEMPIERLMRSTASHPPNRTLPKPRKTRTRTTTRRATRAGQNRAPRRIPKPGAKTRTRRAVSPRSRARRPRGIPVGGR